MSSEPVSTPVVDAVPALEAVPVGWSAPRGFTLSKPVLFMLVLLTGLSLLVSTLLWQRLSAPVRERAKRMPSWQFENWPKRRGSRAGLP